MLHDRAILATIVLTVVFASGYAAAQRQPPTTTVGRSEEMLRSLDLTGEIDSVQGRSLRMRKRTLQPGGGLAIHDHVGRPAIAYLLQGQMTYHQDGEPDMVANSGDGFAEGRSTTHI